jgi:hypothetical protein
MKKLLLSAFAVSLILSSSALVAQTEAIDDFLGLETELLPELKGKQRFTTEDFHTKSDWKVESEKVIQDVEEPTKGQGYSIIPWKTLDPEEYLSVHKWLIERKIKDENPDWKLRLRLVEHKELVGKVLQCRGRCKVYRGSSGVEVQHLSQIFEGDEIRTEKDSHLWLFLMDGTLARLSSEGSLSLPEINFTKNESLILARLNQGHLFWHPRLEEKLSLDEAPETDSHSLPLLVRESNQAFFERQIFRSQKDQEHLKEVLTLEENAIREQFKALSEIQDANTPSYFIQTRAMVVTPNSTLVTRKASFDYVYLPGGKGFFKKRTSRLGEEFSLHLRGYSATTVNTISENSWHEVESTGRSFSSLTEIPGELQVLELLTKRIRTIELAREIWIKDQTLPLLNSLSDAEKLARNYGYNLWGEEFTKRLDFLVEYTRRIETTNLRSLENLLTRLEENGEKARRELSLDLYRASLNHYLLGLKSRYDEKRMKLRELNDLQYYVWILKNGKL